jgi:hypothetical protein
MSRIFLFVVVVVAFSTPVFAQTQDLILPVALNGYTTPPVHYQTIIRIVNMSPSAVEVTLEAYQNDGTAVRILELFPLSRPGTKTVFQIESGGSVEAFTAEDVPSLNGWIRLTFDASATIQAGAEVAVINAPVGPHPICMRPSTEIVTSVQVPALRAASKFSGFAVVRPYRHSGYALVNPSTTQTATAFLSLMDFTGKFIASGTVPIPPQARLSRFVREFLPDAPSDFMGTLRITSTIPIGVGGVNVLFPEGEFTGINVTSPPPSACTQVLAPARNPLTNECRVFPTPCDIPDGWTRTASCN